ncbi:MAG: response regulator, partial [Elainella sp.]
LQSQSRTQSAARLPVAPQSSTLEKFPNPGTTISGNRHTQQKAQAVASKVWNQFKDQYLEQIHALESLVATLKPGVVSSQQQQARQLAHKLVGSMGMFGLSEASQWARELEQLMQSPVLEAAQIAEAVQWTESIKQTVVQAQVDLPPKLRPLPAQMPLPDLSAKILIVDDDLLLAERLRIEAIAWNLQVEIATDLTVARQMIVESPPAMILLDLTFPSDETGLTLIRELEQRSSKIPVVICTAREDLRDRVMAARLGVHAFLQKPLPAHVILKTVTDVLNQQSHATVQDRVLIIDDDPGFLAALTNRLTSHRLQITTSADPQQFWQILAACNPHILILDLEMPEFDGSDLCQVVRADPRWRHLKILFLSAHTEPEAIARAYAAGADEYINKTIPATDLVTRILHRIGQS